MNTKMIPLLTDADIPQDVLGRLHALPPIHIYRMLARTPQCVQPWTDLVKSLYQCQFDKRLREIAICRQSISAKASYEHHQHRLIALANGVTEDELNAIETEAVVTSLDSEANFICSVADEMEKTATIQDATFNTLRERYGDDLMVELLLILSFYCSVARFTNATRTAIENTNVLAGNIDPSKTHTSAN
jgi:alkylhydroperoxidase family enzyme